MPAPAPPAEAAAAAPGRWSARRLLTQPHRLCFSAAALIWAASAAFWALALLWPPAAAAVPLGTLHALAFTLGPMPLFFLGFLFTSAPKWLHAPEPPARALAAGVGVLCLGWLLALAAGPWSAALAGAALTLCALAWLRLWLQLLGLRRGATRRSRHFDAIAAVCGLIGLALGGAGLALLVGEPTRARALARVALWAAVLPVFWLASHRLLPFLAHADAPRAQPDAPQAEAASHPWWVPALPLSACLLQAVLAWPAWPAAAVNALQGLRLLLTAAAGGLCLWLALRWSAHPATRSPLLGRLWRAFAWSGLAWLGLAAAAVPQLSAHMRAALDAAALHAMVLGFAGGTMLAMVTRLSAAQAGHSQAMDALARGLEALLQAVLLARIAAALWPSSAVWALPLSALGWLALALAWLHRHGGHAGRERPTPRRPAPPRLDRK